MYCHPVYIITIEPNIILNEVLIVDFKKIFHSAVTAEFYRSCQSTTAAMEIIRSLKKIAKLKYACKVNCSEKQQQTMIGEN